jgi:hypothetical protein
VSAFDPEVLDENMRCIYYLEEDKIIIKPCEIGDIVWCVGTKCDSDEYESECSIKSSCADCNLMNEYMVFSYEITQSTLIELMFTPIDGPYVWGKTVFRTKEEAQRALERMNCNE